VKNLLRAAIAASRARSLLAYRPDMSRRSLRGSLRSWLLATFCSQPPQAPIGGLSVARLTDSHATIPKRETKRPENGARN
jgi:hypothetical protein